MTDDKLDQKRYNGTCFPLILPPTPGRSQTTCIYPSALKHQGGKRAGGNEAAPTGQGSGTAAGGPGQAQDAGLQPVDSRGSWLFQGCECPGSAGPCKSRAHRLKLSREPPPDSTTKAREQQRHALRTATRCSVALCEAGAIRLSPYRNFLSVSHLRGDRRVWGWSLRLHSDECPGETDAADGWTTLGHSKFLGSSSLFSSFICLEG